MITKKTTNRPKKTKKKLTKKSNKIKIRSKVRNVQKIENIVGKAQYELAVLSNYVESRSYTRIGPKINATINALNLLRKEVN